VTLAQLKAFYWIATLKSFRAAADRLHLAQPTISLRIRELERQLGERLFERVGANVVLTAAGQELLPYAERILSLSTEIGNRLRSRDPLNRLLRLGVTDAFSIACLPQMIDLLTREHPSLRLDLTVMHSVPLMQSLRDGKLDVCIMVKGLTIFHGASDDVDASLDQTKQFSDVATESLAVLRLGWVASPNVSIERGVCRPEQLARHRILVPTADSQSIAARWFSEDCVGIQCVNTCSNLSTVLTLTKAGLGISLLPLFIISEELKRKSLRVLRIEPKPPDVELAAMYLRANKNSQVAEVIQAAKTVLAMQNEVVLA
jgi:DNA-binding transcriptional LysR family regulator